MIGRARRLPARVLTALARRALLALCLWPVGASAAEVITQAEYTGPTERYGHAVLGDGIEHETLVLTFRSGQKRRFTLPGTSVFEDTAPRVIDLDGDQKPEVLTVESDHQKGARLAIYGADGQITATPYIGTRFRWLAPLGAADLDGDGIVEVAYVDRPHLAKTLRLWRYSARSLTPLTDFAGVTNHRIGEVDIAGGIRHCSLTPEMILSDASWQRLLALTYDGEVVELRAIGRDTSREAFAKAMACQD